MDSTLKRSMLKDHFVLTALTRALITTDVKEKMLASLQKQLSQREHMPEAETTEALQDAVKFVKKLTPHDPESDQGEQDQQGEDDYSLHPYTSTIK